MKNKFNTLERQAPRLRLVRRTHTQHRNKMAYLLLAVCLGLMLGGCSGGGEAESGSGSEETPEVYIVTFQSGEDTLEDVVVEVEQGKAADAPGWSLPGRKLSGWSEDISHVTEDMTVRAQWSSDRMTGVEISEYAESRTATISVTDLYDNHSTGSGFFIDGDGTLVTNYHVIEYADTFEVQLGNAVYDVKKIIQFSEKYDLAVLKVDIEDNDYFELSEEVKKGQQVYAIGSALGGLTDTMTSGIVSHASREMGMIDCIQTDASISHGNSGGPLVDETGKVVGVNSFSFTAGSNLNLAIKISMLDKLGEERNFSVTDYIEWWKTETARSYRPTSASDTDKYSYSLINTYQNYTGSKCIASADSLYLKNISVYEEGYNDQCWVFFYSYDQAKYDSYVSYLKELGFVYDPDESGTYDLGECATFYSVSSGFTVDLIVTNERSEYEGKYLMIRTMYDL